ncbi:MAG: acetate kinase [Rhizobiales bacterium 65-79]|jgi:acetate kinase|nr:acetate/propionate family kinase [Hyphomicrobiales bacterium]OJU01045.1 MAG: acetate kinase [Rhizobiales bacterium 65-79]
MPDTILTINAGSSSIKFALFAIGASGVLERSARGEVERLTTEPSLVISGRDGKVVEKKEWGRESPGFEPILRTVIERIEAHQGGDNLIAVGHRIVHGGSTHVRPERITPDVLADLDRLVPLAPLHQKYNLDPVRVLVSLRPGLPQIACFDTAFHATMAPVAYRYALPPEFEAEGIRKYGFHGLSYEYVAERLREIAPSLAEGRVIVAHLGNGASLAAIHGGRGVDTTMGFTALDGLVMGTRCGSIDPGVLLYLEQQRGMSAADVYDLLYRRSGLLGMSGVASDMRTLLASEEPRAREAVELFVHRIAGKIGEMAASLGGLDGLVFTAGIGERSADIREMVCAKLGWLGAEIDPVANERHAPVIARPGSRIDIRVVPTDEELMIARHTLKLA